MAEKTRDVAEVIGDETRGKSRDDGIRALEFFSGIGCLHWSLNAAVPSARVLSAFDLNQTANAVYKINFPKSKVVHSSIVSLKVEDFDGERFVKDINMWLMSPPCQPYSRRGKCLDDDDPRARAFVHLVRRVLRNMRCPPEYLLVENVEGFESSRTRAMLLDVASSRGYRFCEFVLSPHNFGIPYKRDRYFFVARRRKTRGSSAVWTKCDAAAKCNILRTIPGDSDCRRVDYVEGTCEMGTAASAAMWNKLNAHCKRLGEFLETHDAKQAAELLVPRSVLAKSKGVIDIVAEESRQCCCFTKSYGKFTRGSGSVVLTTSKTVKHPVPRDDLDFLVSLRLRYFSPREIANLHGLPRRFVFPEGLSLKQKYKLLGNSLSVTVVRALISVSRPRRESKVFQARRGRGEVIFGCLLLMGSLFQ